jgi:hypothetical protein
MCIQGLGHFSTCTFESYYLTRQGAWLCTRPDHYPFRARSMAGPGRSPHRSQSVAGRELTAGPHMEVLGIWENLVPPHLSALLSLVMWCSATLDVLFLLDGSHSIGKGSFERCKHFAITICEALDISPERVSTASLISVSGCL